MKAVSGGCPAFRVAYLYKIPGSFQLHVLVHGDAIVINRNVAAGTKVVDPTKQVARFALSNLK